MQKRGPLHDAYVTAVKCRMGVSQLAACYLRLTRTGAPVPAERLLLTFKLLNQGVSESKDNLNPWLQTIATHAGGAWQYGQSLSHASCHALSGCFASSVRSRLQGAFPTIEEGYVTDADVEPLLQLAHDERFGAFPSVHFELLEFFSFLNAVETTLWLEHARTANALGIRSGSPNREGTGASEALDESTAEIVLRLPDHYFQHQPGKWIGTKELECVFGIPNAQRRAFEWRSHPRPELGGRVIWARRQVLIGWVYSLADARLWQAYLRENDA